MKQDLYDIIMSRVERSLAKPGSPIFLFAVSAAAIIVWMIWAGSSPAWAIWAGAIDVVDEAVPVRTAAAGAWGDSFGGFNALVGALGFGAVAITLNLQYRSTERQKQEQHIARFEDNFFRLVELMRSLGLGLRFQHTEAFYEANREFATTIEQSGHLAVEAAYREVAFWTFKFHQGRKIKRSIVSTQYDNYVHNRYEWCFAPYFRIIYTILNKISTDKILTSDQKHYYGNILRSQLTSFEIGLLAFNGTSSHSKDLDKFINEFRMLKYLPKKRRRVLGNIFPDEAYQARS